MTSDCVSASFDATVCGSGTWIIWGRWVLLVGILVVIAATYFLLASVFLRGLCLISTRLTGFKSRAS